MKQINMLGFGVMGRQAAALFQLLSYDVFVWDHNITDDKKAMFATEVRKMEKFLGLDSMKQGGITFVKNIEELVPVLTYEALIEDLPVKRSVISHLSYAISKGVLLTNTSSYRPSEIHPYAMGLHFFNPIYRLKFAELSSYSDAASSSVKDLLNCLNKHGFEIITTSDNRGYVGNYLLFQEIANALKLIDRFNYKTSTIDRILSHMGRSVSVFDIIDLVGVDITRKILMNLKEVDSSIYCSQLLDEALKKNILGKKNKTSIRSVIDI